MADSETSHLKTPEDPSSPYYGDVSTKKKRLMKRIFAAITVILVFLAVLFCFIKGSHEHRDYLLGINILLSSLIVGMMTWWYYKSVIPTEKFYFIVFMAICLIFQTLVTDIFVWQRKEGLNPFHDGKKITPTSRSPNETTLVPPHY